ncbi:MAG: GNAT family N-acetyltransferase [Primorskyibacter sp.]
MLLRIRLVDLDDLPSIQAIAQVAYSPYIARIGKPPAPMQADFATHQAHGALWLAEQGPKITGYVVAIPHDDHMALDNIAAVPSGRGTGGRLIAWVEDLARAAQTPCVRLYTNVAMTENLTLYPRLGYVETHRATDQGFRRVYFEKRLAPVRPHPPT